MHGNITNNAGFTLLEVLVALTIFAVGMLGIAGVQLNAMDFNSNSNTRTVAAALAQGAMERILATDGGDPSFKTTNPSMVCANSICFIDPNDQTATTLNVPGSGSYSATWGVTTKSPVDDIATITVTVTDPTGSRVSLTNYRSIW